MEIENLKKRIAELEKENEQLRATHHQSQDQSHTSSADTSVKEKQLDGQWWEKDHDLTQSQVERYSRQLLLHSFGPRAQSCLCRSGVLVVGAGGLGSSALLYLSGAGFGRIGIVDKDTVALNNLHRQVIHNELSVGEAKTLSARKACNELNSAVAVEVYSEGLTPENALDIIEGYDVVIDASDNAPTRYLISDACVLAGKPLVSGAAIGTDGQLTVYNYWPDGPCYRCLFPTAPPTGACSSCSEAGVLGPVPGVIGVLQALEAIKIVSNIGSVLCQRLLIVDLLATDFRLVKIRGRNPNCAACGSQSSLTRFNIASYDYAAFTGQPFNESAPVLPVTELRSCDRMTVQELSTKLKMRDRQPFVLIDVRPLPEYEICHLKGSLHYPFASLTKRLPDMVDACSSVKGKDETKADGGVAVVVVCRRGNDSQIVAQALKNSDISSVKDVSGGLEAWHEQVDTTFLHY